MQEDKQSLGWCYECGAAVDDNGDYGRGYTEQTRPARWKRPELQSHSPYGVQDVLICECCDPEAARKVIRELSAERRELLKGA